MIAPLVLWSATALGESLLTGADWDPGDRTTATLPGEVQANDSKASGDGVYGRFGGDLDLGIALGGELADDTARGAARVSLHSFWMAGGYVAFARGSADSAAQSVLSLGIDLRPAFLPRWSQNMSRGPALLDLVVDSISLGTAVFWAEPARGELGDRRGLELSLGLGVPLFARASGPWLEGRGLVRWPDDGGSAEPVVLVLLSWHTLLLSPWSRAVVD